MISSMESSALKFILNAGVIREDDLILLLKSSYNYPTSARRAFNNMLTKGLIKKYSYKIEPTRNHHKNFENVYYISTEGRKVITKSNVDPYYFKLRIKEPTKTAGPISNTIDRNLTDTGIAAMFYACNIPVFPHDKPSLAYLRDTIQGIKASPKPIYKDNLTKEQCLTILKSGVYYSLKEFYDFTGSNRNGSNDMYLGTRIRGLYISDRNCYPIYTSKKYDNKLLRINTKGEDGLINALKELRTFTHIYRTNDDYAEKMINSKGLIVTPASYTTGPSAIIISDGEMLAYATATAHKKGKAPQIDADDLNEKLNKNKPVPRDTALLTARSKLYDKIYVVPSNMNGIYALLYLVTHDLESIKSEGIELMKFDKGFSYDSNLLGLYPYCDISSGKKNSVCYMPVFEAKELYKIANSQGSPTILTCQDLLNMIAHSVSKDCGYYDIINRRPFESDSALIYDENGNIKGQTVLDNYLKLKGLTFDKATEGVALPKRLGKNKIEFYNALARGKLSPNEIENEVKTKPYTSAKRQYKKKTNISLSINGDTLEKIKELAGKDGISLSRMTEKLYLDHINRQKA